MFRVTVLPSAETFQLNADQTVLRAALLGHADVATTHDLPAHPQGRRLRGPQPAPLDALIELLSGHRQAPACGRLPVPTTVSKPERRDLHRFLCEFLCESNANQRQFQAV